MRGGLGTLSEGHYYKQTQWKSPAPLPCVHPILPSLLASLKMFSVCFFPEPISAFAGENFKGKKYIYLFIFLHAFSFPSCDVDWMERIDLQV